MPPHIVDSGGQAAFNAYASTCRESGQVKDDMIMGKEVIPR